ncbi:hypothetical protein E2C01_075198 [Portunus trituberculatus]|uniref:Uncharacterized protein n=1 Tax=Portunus trituberculatus TaxID=210409 RepID=A0A5B7IEI1_PORTR|nr:hypothetical protein [Portunus trituberculatus]
MPALTDARMDAFNTLDPKLDVQLQHRSSWRAEYLPFPSFQHEAGAFAAARSPSQTAAGIIHISRAGDIAAKGEAQFTHNWPGQAHPTPLRHAPSRLAPDPAGHNQ